MKTLLKPLLAATLLSLTLGSVAMAKPDQARNNNQQCMQKGDRGHHADEMKMPHQPRFLRGIDLTDAQKDQIFALSHAEMPKMRALMKERAKLEQALRQLPENYTEDKAITIADQLASIERNSVLARVSHQQKIMRLLTPAQKKQAAENREKFEQRRAFKSTKGKISKQRQLDYRQPVAM